MIRSSIAARARIALASALAMSLCGLSAGSSTAGDLAADRSKLTETYGAQLAALADALASEGLAAPADEVRGWLPERPANTITLFSLPPRAPWSTPEPPVWLARFRTLREAQSEALFSLAKIAAQGDRGALAMELALEAARENPDHAAARRLLGYLKKGDEWHRPFALRQLNAGKVWHPQFGWLPSAHVPRYEHGERSFQNRWISAEEDRRRHAEIDLGWQIETANYQITTNHSLEEGVRLAERLEQFHDFWEILFIGYLEKPGQLAKRFSGAGSPPRDARKHNVVYFRDRAGYNRALLPTQPQIEITLGFYSDRQQTAYFFAGEEQQAGLVYHEATHQLFQESRATAAAVGTSNNVWIAEGIACYWETLREFEPGRYRIGGDDAGRLPAARRRLLVDQFYTPLGELVGYGLDRLQHDPNIAKLYSESAGLATFFMHYDQGRYRPALVKYLSAVYTGAASEETLAKFCGQGYSDLDRQYRDFLSQP